MIEWKLSSDGMEWTAGADDLYLSVFDTGDRIMWDVGVSMRRRSTSEGKAASFDEGKAKAETFAREWVAAQAAALNPDWSSEPVASFAIRSPWIPVGERLPEHHVEVLVAGVDRGPFQAVGMWHGAADEIFDEEPGWFIWNRPFTYRPDFVAHWRPLPPLPAAEVKP